MAEQEKKKKKTKRRQQEEEQQVSENSLNITIKSKYYGNGLFLIIQIRKLNFSTPASKFHLYKNCETIVSILKK